jgi:hypothetical protein
MRRFAMIAFAALTVWGCDAATVTDPAGETAESGGYTLEIRAGEGAQTFLIVAPDGRTIGARSAEGASALMDSERARALFADPPPQEEVSEVMGLRLPGFEMSVGGGGEDENGENGQVRLSLGGDGQTVVVNADEGGPGEADDRAYVRITGADEDAVREFIASADTLSPSVQAEMLAALGLPETAPKAE